MMSKGIEAVEGAGSEKSYSRTAPAALRLHIPNQPSQATLERKLRRLLRPFRNASIVTITLFMMSVLLSSYLIFLLVNSLWLFSDQFSDSVHMHNLLLLFSLFFMFLGTIGYVLLTCTSLNGGVYGDGVWWCAYCCVSGLLCCLICAVTAEKDEYQTVSTSDLLGHGSHVSRQDASTHSGTYFQASSVPRLVELPRYEPGTAYL
jgi:hypothetical protein